MPRIVTHDAQVFQIMRILRIFWLERHMSCHIPHVTCHMSGFPDNANTENISVGTSHYRPADPRSHPEGNILVVRRRSMLVMRRNMLVMRRNMLLMRRNILVMKRTQMMIRCDDKEEDTDDDDNDPSDETWSLLMLLA